MEEDDLAKMYAAEAAKSLASEARARVAEVTSEEEDARLLSLSLVDLSLSGCSPDLVGALMARLGDVRAALIGHGGGIVVDEVRIVESDAGGSRLFLQLNLDGACVACGAAPGTLESIRDDLMRDDEVADVVFSASMLESYDDLVREFLSLHGKVTFV